MIVGIVRETFPNERRVALVPSALPTLLKAGLEAVVESGAGECAGASDAAYEEYGASLASNRREVFAAADIVAQVRSAGANLEAGLSDLDLLRPGQTVIGFCEPFAEPQAAAQVASRHVNLVAMELIPRITRAQSMDALSSMSTIAGYKAVLLAAAALPKMFPLLMTAAGTVSPAKVLVIGAGVAGLQAIATARRLGAVVEAYDVRPAVKEQVESLGARFLDLPLDTSDAQDSAGYAKRQDETTAARQQELMLAAVAANDVVITTASVPGQRAPLLITSAMVQAMAKGSVIVDLAAERGGNCELTQPGRDLTAGGVNILGPVNLAASIPVHASQLYSRNVTALIMHLVPQGRLVLDSDDEITREVLVSRDGLVVHPKVNEALVTRS